MSENKETTIITHSGSFHADDVFAVATLRILLGDAAQVKVIRTRDQVVIETGDYVVDVGGIYDESKNRFDHHQASGAGVRQNGIPYAAFGLVWKKYGETLCGSREVAEMVEQKLVMPLDATDNGVEISSSVFRDIWPYGIQNVVTASLPTWKEDQNTDPIFDRLVQFAVPLLKREILKAQHQKDAERLVEEIYANTPDKRIIVLPEKYPWTDVLGKYDEPLFVIYPDNEKWHVKAMRNDEGSFANRKDFPESWAGKMNHELITITGIPDALFCHLKRFLVVASSKDGAIALAKLALVKE